jgi:hypothetical protein
LIAHSLLVSPRLSTLTTSMIFAPRTTSIRYVSARSPEYTGSVRVGQAEMLKCLSSTLVATASSAAGPSELAIVGVDESWASDTRKLVLNP